LVFSSVAFLFLFLPAVLGLYFFARPRFRNAVLVAASLLYYSWGEPAFLPIVLTSIILNYGFGLLVELAPSRFKHFALALAVVTNIGLLAYYKYFNFFAENAGVLLAWLKPGAKPLALSPVILPLGISFFTFHALSYVIDIYRKEAPAQRNPFLLTLYIVFFPQLIAGPIVRYHEIADQLTVRTESIAEASIGIQRFIVGIGKKVLLANFAAEVADAVFALSRSEMTPRLAWLGASAYALQIYFDFSGYSDMAIGLAHVFGFRFPENFDYPYISQSVTEFWRRWHMSLSRWFRDYLYIPLGGNRAGPFRLYVNLVTVFFLCGLWHGASWNFVVWGMLHGAFLVAERLGLQRVLKRAPAPVRHVYTLLVIIGTWVVFRATTLDNARDVLLAMLGHGAHAAAAGPTVAALLKGPRKLALLIGVAGCTPVVPWLAAKCRVWSEGTPSAPWVAESALELARLGSLAVIFVFAVMRLSSGTYNPFIYFRF
jgi:alginate O-acetyltransferase complex protein AlgI